MIDWCDSCAQKAQEFQEAFDKEYPPRCDWCGKVEKTYHTRDFDEGLSGPVYEVCNSCLAKQRAYVARECEDDYY